MPPAPEAPSVALITGAASGIGLAVAQTLAADGYAVALCDVDAGRLQEARSTLVHGARALIVPCDVRDGARVREAVSAVEAELGAISALAMVAGILRPGSGLSCDDADWQASLDVNATGVWNTARAVLPRMVQRRRGSLVTVSSNAALTPRIGMASYAASKAAALMLTKCLGLEVAEFGVRCNVVCPGSTDTPMLRALWDQGGGHEQTLRGSLAHHRLGIPLGRIAEAADIADTVRYLLSDRARHITLQAICVDGGATL